MWIIPAADPDAQSVLHGPNHGSKSDFRHRGLTLLKSPNACMNANSENICNRRGRDFNGL
jgi:hypothetical protein